MARQRHRDGVSAAFDEDDAGTLQLIQGSIQKLKLTDGDLVVVRVASSKELDIAKVRDVMATLLKDHKAAAKLLVMPAYMDIERMPRDMAVELLRGIVEGP